MLLKMQVIFVIRIIIIIKKKTLHENKSLRCVFIRDTDSFYSGPLLMKDADQTYQRPMKAEFIETKSRSAPLRCVFV